MQGNNQEFMDRMNAVDCKAQLLDSDDLYQEAMLKLYERFCIEPDILDNNNSYIWCYASWMMKNTLNHAKNMYVKNVVDIMETEKGDIQQSYPKGHYPPPESEATRLEVHDIACHIPEQYRTIYDATIQGYELDEIADMFGITKGALKWRSFAMIETLKQACHKPIKDSELIIRRMNLWPSVLNTP